MQTSISLPFITATADGPKHIETNLSRAKFEELASDLLDRCRIPVEQALKDANLAVSDINEVILVGGSTRIPAVQVRPLLCRAKCSSCLCRSASSGPEKPSCSTVVACAGMPPALAWPDADGLSQKVLKPVVDA